MYPHRFFHVVCFRMLHPVPSNSAFVESDLSKGKEVIQNGSNGMNCEKCEYLV